MSETESQMMITEHQNGILQPIRNMDFKREI